jgi:hypothetical protein
MTDYDVIFKAPGFIQNGNSKGEIKSPQIQHFTTGGQGTLCVNGSNHETAAALT